MLCTLAKTGGVPAPSTLIGHDPTISSRSYAALFPEYTKNFEVRRLFILCVTSFGPMWCMMSCSTLTCHLHGNPSLTSLACIFTNLARSTNHRQDILPSKGVCLYSRTCIHNAGTTLVANAYTARLCSEYPCFLILYL